MGARLSPRLKQCSKCKERKAFRFFPKSKHHKDGRSPICNACYKLLYKDPKRDELRAKERALRRTPLGRYKQMLGSAKYREIGSTLTFEQYEVLIALPCYYCSGPLPVAGTGLDRIDNDKGYDFDNVVPCCTECNRIRGNFLTMEEMKAVAALLCKMRSSEGELP